MGLEQVELVMEVEDELGISIDADVDDGQSANTVGAFYDLVLQIIRADPQSELARRPRGHAGKADQCRESPRSRPLRR